MVFLVSANNVIDPVQPHVFVVLCRCVSRHKILLLLQMGFIVHCFFCSGERGGVRVCITLNPKEAKCPASHRASPPQRHTPSDHYPHSGAEGDNHHLRFPSSSAIPPFLPLKTVINVGTISRKIIATSHVCGSGGLTPQGSVSPCLWRLSVTHSEPPGPKIIKTWILKTPGLDRIQPLTWPGIVSLLQHLRLYARVSSIYHSSWSRSLTSGPKINACPLRALLPQLRSHRSRRMGLSLRCVVISSHWVWFGRARSIFLMNGGWYPLAQLSALSGFLEEASWFEFYEIRIVPESVFYISFILRKKFEHKMKQSQSLDERGGVIW